jgi:D-glycero-D-manno-heptose 1,7-bisphosphate phosphatase
MITVFLDRDGVVNACSYGRWVNNVDDLEVYPFAAEAIRLLNDNEVQVFIVTNQSGVHSGHLPHHQHYAINAKMLNVLDDGGAHIVRIYECLHGKNPVTCHCRKPDTLMIKRAIEDYKILSSSAWLVGDLSTDIEMAYNASSIAMLDMLGIKIKPIMVRTGLNNDEELTKATELAAKLGRELYIEQDLLAAAKRIIRHI